MPPVLRARAQRRDDAAPPPAPGHGERLDGKRSTTRTASSSRIVVISHNSIYSHPFTVLCPRMHFPTTAANFTHPSFYVPRCRKPLGLIDTGNRRDLVLRGDLRLPKLLSRSPPQAIFRRFQKPFPFSRSVWYFPCGWRASTAREQARSRDCARASTQHSSHPQIGSGSIMFMSVLCCEKSCGRTDAEYSPGTPCAWNLRGGDAATDFSLRNEPLP